MADDAAAAAEVMIVNGEHQNYVGDDDCAEVEQIPLLSHS